MDFRKGYRSTTGSAHVYRIFGLYIGITSISKIEILDMTYNAGINKVSFVDNFMIYFMEDHAVKELDYDGSNSNFFKDCQCHNS